MLDYSELLYGNVRSRRILTVNFHGTVERLLLMMRDRLATNEVVAEVRNIVGLVTLLG